jgi:FKBP-type peptidyl-prolyl cis-trans isomerase 2
MPIQKSDFIVVDYTGKVKETGEVFDTTSEETAKTNKLYKEGDIYEPRLIVTGEGWLLKALDEALLTFKLNKEETVEIPPEKAFGNRDPEKVKLIPVKRLAARGITPRLGAQIEYDKRLATVRTMGSGRVTLDFNPPLAGKTLVYEVTIQKQLKTAEEKVSALIHRRIPAVEVEKFEFKIGKAEVTINMPAEAFYIEGIQLAKRGISMDIQRFLPVLTTIQFVEYFAKPEVVAKAKTEVKKKTAKKSAKKTKDVEKKTIKTSEKKVEKKTEKKTKTKAKAKAKAKDISKVTK